MVLVNPQFYCTLLDRLDSPSRLVQSVKNCTMILTDRTHTMNYFYNIAACWSMFWASLIFLALLFESAWRNAIMGICECCVRLSSKEELNVMPWKCIKINSFDVDSVSIVVFKRTMYRICSLSRPTHHVLCHDCHCVLYCHDRQMALAFDCWNIK